MEQMCGLCWGSAVDLMTDKQRRATVNSCLLGSSAVCLAHHQQKLESRARRDKSLVSACISNSGFYLSHERMMRGWRLEIQTTNRGSTTLRTIVPPYILP
eukprot:3940962-Rhodomonas_salina.2